MAKHLVHHRERHRLLHAEELNRVVALDVRVRDLANLDDLQARRAHAVAGRHLLVKRVDGFVHADLAVLLVRVVEARARLVADPDPKVLNRRDVLFEDLVARDDLTVRLLNFLKAGQEVPGVKNGLDAMDGGWKVSDDGRGGRRAVAAPGAPQTLKCQSPS